MLISILIIIWLWFLYAILYQKYDPYGEIGFEVFFTIVLGGALLTMFNLFFSTITKKEVYREDHIVNIYSLRDGSTINGSFTLGSGYVKSEEFYFCFAKNEEKFYRWTIPVNDSYLIESDETPKVSWQTIHYKPHWALTFINFCKSEDTKFDITVPKNTIIKEFKAE